jgi:DNA-binding NarL/FixJ family response regulator
VNVLVVGDGLGRHSGTLRGADSRARLHLVTSVADARALVDRGFDWVACVVERHLADGSGIEVLEYFREAYPHTRAAAHSAQLDDAIIRAAVDFRFRIIPMPLDSAAGAVLVADFVRGALATAAGQADPVPGAARAWAVRMRPTPAETEAFLLFAQGLRFDEAAAVLKKRVTTVASQAASICMRSGDSSIQDAVRRFAMTMYRELWRAGAAS